MSGQDWLTPAAAPAPSPYGQPIPGSALPVPGHQLRPLTLSEILDRTFAVYRSRFWLFCGIAAIAGAVNLVAQIIQLSVQHATKIGVSTRASVAAAIVEVVVVLVFFLAYGVTQAATVHALTEVYLGREATIAASMKATIGRWWVYAVIGLWQYMSFLWLPAALMVPAFVLIAVLGPTLGWMGGLVMLFAIPIGIPFGIIMLIRNLLAVQATVDEHLTIRASMRRSKQLAKNAKGRIFVVLLIWFALYMVVGVVQAPMIFLVTRAVMKGGEAIGLQSVMLIVGFLGHSLVFPVGLIGLSLVYFDQRVRMEAYDLELLIGATPAPAPYVPVVVTPVEQAAPIDWSAAPPTYAPAPVESTSAAPTEAEAQTPDEHSL